MKTLPPFLALVLLAPCMHTLHAATKYFDQNGTAASFGLTGGGSYVWNTTDLIWNSASSGGVGTISAWTSNADTAVFSSGGAGIGYSVALQSNIGVANLSVVNVGGAINITRSLTFTGNYTLTLGSGAIITNNAGDSRNLIFGDNVNVVGDFTIKGAGDVSISGAGTAYNGTITIAGAATGALEVDSNHRYGSSTKVVHDAGYIRVNANADVTFAELSGAGASGLIMGASGYGTLKVNQASTTTIGSALGTNIDISTANQLHFEKSGTGTLSFVGTTNHRTVGNIKVSGGSLYMKGEITSGTNKLTVTADGNFGGGTTIKKAVVLEGATSQLTAGMLGEAGTLTLGNGITALSGATFNFKLNGEDGGGDTLNSKIVLSLGSWNVIGPVIANFIDLDTGDYSTGNSYTVTLVEASGVTTSNWSVGYMPGDWAVGANPFSVTGDNLQFTFTVVPEPSAYALVTGGAFALCLARRRKFSGKR